MATVYRNIKIPYIFILNVKIVLIKRDDERKLKCFKKVEMQVYGLILYLSKYKGIELEYLF